MPTSINLTNPDEPSDIPHEKIRSWDFKEALVLAFEALGVPRTTAEIATIDLKGMMNVCYHNKLTPIQAAEMMIEKVTAMYKKDDGWLFSG